MSFVTDLLSHRIKDTLTLEMQTKIPVGDLSRVSVVKIGRFQDDPTMAGNHIAINYGDPTNPLLLDGNAALRDRQRDQIGVNAPGYFVGGGSMWWRTIFVSFGCFFMNDKLSEEAAQTAASEVLGRLLYTLGKISVSGIKDSYGETVAAFIVYGNTMSQSGGPPDQYIWRGVARCEFLTDRP